MTPASDASAGSAAHAAPAPPSAPVITLYGAAWCEDTRRTRRLLRRLGLDHRYRDVDEDIEALERATTLNHGVRRTPVVTLGTDDADVYVEPSNAAMTIALLRHGWLTREHVQERLHLQNVGDFERVLRVSAGLLTLASKSQAPRALRGALTLTGAGLLITGVIGWCPFFHGAGVTSLNGPGDRPDEAERQSWLRPAQRGALDDTD